MRRIRLGEKDALLLTRERGRAIGMKLPQAGSWLLDFKGVRAVSPSFLDELLRTAEERGIEVAVENAAPDVRQRLKMLQQVNEDRAASASA